MNRNRFLMRLPARLQEHSNGCGWQKKTGNKKNRAGCQEFRIVIRENMDAGKTRTKLWR
jgi:hypothetical protein